MKIIFIDTSFVIALVSENDKYHFLANQLAEEIENCTFFSTDLVLFQAYEIFSEKYQEKAEEIISTFLEVNDVQIANTAIYEREVLSFKKSNFDMPENLIDYVSGLVMLNEGIRIIATFNQNFAEKGFYVIPGIYFNSDIISGKEFTKIKFRKIYRAEENNSNFIGTSESIKEQDSEKLTKSKKWQRLLISTCTILALVSIVYSVVVSWNWGELLATFSSSQAKNISELNKIINRGFLLAATVVISQIFYKIYRTQDEFKSFIFLGKITFVFVAIKLLL